MNVIFYNSTGDFYEYESPDIAEFVNLIKTAKVIKINGRYYVYKYHDIDFDRNEINVTVG